MFLLTVGYSSNLMESEFSVTKKGHSQVRHQTVKGILLLPMAAPCFWMK